VSEVVIENPIINSPFDEPTRHFRFNDEGITDEEVVGRRVSSYFVPIGQDRRERYQPLRRRDAEGVRCLTKESFVQEPYRDGRGMKLLELCLTVLSLLLTANSQADTTVKPYVRKNGTEVSSYTRNATGSGSNETFSVPTLSIQPIYTTPEPPVYTAPSDQTLSPAAILDNEIAASLPVSTSVTSRITSNGWKSDTLIIHGTLTNTDSNSITLATPALVGYDARNQEVNAGKINLANPELKGGQTEAFTAEISDPRKAIKFTKLVGIRSRYYVATQPPYVVATPEVTTTPFATPST
jgi:hypothetical protein